jgi:Flp pilus assembly pilin Flp
LGSVFSCGRVRAGERDSNSVVAPDRAVLAKRHIWRRASSPIGGGSKAVLARLWSDESGATLIEYTLLISLVMLAILSLLISVGGWASGMWGNLLAALNQ